MARVKVKNKSKDEVAKGLGVLPQAGRRRFESSPHLKMEIEKFIIDKIQQIPILPEVNLGDTTLEDYIYKSLMSKKFRKYSVTPGFEDHIRQLVNKSVKNNIPIKIVWPFGGYKLWSLMEAPEVDWAELFSILYFIEWLKPILAVYKYGVWFDFYSDACIVPIMNNIPKDDIDSYQTSFIKLLDFIRPNLPKNLMMTFNTVVGQYKDENAFIKELEDNIKINTQKFKIEPFQLTQEQTAAILLNVKPNPNQLLEPDWKEKVQIIHNSYAQASKRRPYYKNPDTIMLVNRAYKDALAIGSTKTSVVKFWVGIGAIGPHKDSFIEYVLSPKQATQLGIKAINIEIPGLDMKNFKSIRFIE